MLEPIRPTKTSTLNIKEIERLINKKSLQRMKSKM